MSNVTGSLSKHTQWHTNVRRLAIKLKQKKYAKRTETNGEHKWRTFYACQQFTALIYNFKFFNKFFFYKTMRYKWKRN